MALNGGKRERITSEEGNNEVTVSPDEKKLAILYSYANKPWELYLMDNKPGAPMKQITNSTSEEFEAYSWKVPDFITFEAGMEHLSQHVYISLKMPDLRDRQ